MTNEEMDAFTGLQNKVQDLQFDKEYVAVQMALIRAERANLRVQVKGLTAAVGALGATVLALALLLL